MPQKLDKKRKKLKQKWVQVYGDLLCFYCAQRMVFITLDHYKPKRLGGTDAYTNLCLCCYECNQIKGSETMLSKLDPGHLHVHKLNSNTS